MVTFKQIARIRWVMLVVALGLALYYFLVFRPLSHRAEALDDHLADVRQELLNVNLENSGIYDLELGQIRQAQTALQASLTATEKAGQTITTRTEFEPEIRAKLKEPFLLIDFQNERQKRIEQVIALAKTQQVTLETATLAGFPEYNAEMTEPNLLWAELAIVHHLLTLAINSKVASVKSVSVLPIQSDRANGGTEAYWVEIPVRIELIAPMESAASFLLALPLLTDEVKTAGLPDCRAGKPALFLDNLMLRKQTPEKPSEVNLDAVVCGFVRTLDLHPTRVEEKTRQE
jgi:hypothetical protein